MMKIAPEADIKLDLIDPRRQIADAFEVHSRNGNSPERHHISTGLCNCFFLHFLIKTDFLPAAMVQFKLKQTECHPQSIGKSIMDRQTDIMRLEMNRMLSSKPSLSKMIETGGSVNSFPKPRLCRRSSVSFLQITGDTGLTALQFTAKTGSPSRSGSGWKSEQPGVMKKDQIVN